MPCVVHFLGVTMERRIKLSGVAVAAVLIVAVAGLVSAVPSGTAGPAQAPQNTDRPTISDTSPAANQTLTADPGEWSGTTPITFTYQWRRCNAGGQQCADITGAIARTYLVRSADVGNTLRVRVTARNAAGQGTADSVPTRRGAPPPAGTGPADAG